MTDPHVHLRDWNQSSKETIVHGMLAGARACFDVFFDMPNCNPPLTERATVEKRILLGQKAEQELKNQSFDVHYHVYCGITEDRSQIREMIRVYNDLFPKVCGMAVCWYWQIRYGDSWRPFLLCRPWAYARFCCIMG